MIGRIDSDTLKRMIADDEIDTVITAFPDMYGRLVGKRFVGRYFVDEVMTHGMHACDYLLACDVDMDPVPGYSFTSWAKGYGDFHPVPDFTTMRVASWLQKAAIVLCDDDRAFAALEAGRNAAPIRFGLGPGHGPHEIDRGTVLDAIDQYVAESGQFTRADGCQPTDQGHAHEDNTTKSRAVRAISPAFPRPPALPGVRGRQPHRPCRRRHRSAD